MIIVPFTFLSYEIEKLQLFKLLFRATAQFARGRYIDYGGSLLVHCTTIVAKELSL